MSAITWPRCALGDLSTLALCIGESFAVPKAIFLKPVLTYPFWGDFSGLSVLSRISMTCSGGVVSLET